MKKTTRQKYITAEEFEKLLSVTTKPRDWMMFFLAGNLGLRMGETVRLRIQDIEWTSRYIRVPTLKQTIGKKGPKQGALKRGELPEKYVDIPVAEEVLDILSSYLKAMGLNKTGWLFPDGKGSHTDPLSGRRAFKRWAARAGLSSVYSAHCLRHYFGTRVYREHHDIYAVQTLLRHRNISMSALYSGMDIEGKRDLIAGIKVIGIKKTEKEN